METPKQYILKTFKYREYAENFSKKIRLAIKKLDPFAVCDATNRERNIEKGSSTW